MVSSGGVGHKSFQKAIQKFCDDRWPEELKNVREDVETENDLIQVPMDDADEDSDTAECSFSELTGNPDANDAELSEDEVQSDSEQELLSEHEDSESESEADELERVPSDPEEVGDDDNLELEYID